MEIITIGRGPQNTVVINNEQVSRIHCQITKKDNGTYEIVDLGSTNGTFVNGRRIAGPTVLCQSDCVRLGTIDFNWQQAISLPQLQDLGPTFKPAKNVPIWLIIVVGILIVVAIGIALFFGLSGSDGGESVKERGGVYVYGDHNSNSTSRVAKVISNNEINLKLESANKMFRSASDSIRNDQASNNSKTADAVAICKNCGRPVSICICAHIR